MRQYQRFGRSVEDQPQRYSNVRLARLEHGAQQGCSYCFPHGLETVNGARRKDLRCWKRYRRWQWREEKEGKL